MSEPRTFHGGCHCGAIAVTFTTATPPDRLQVRACGCSFCRRHGGRTVSDPAGRARLTVHDPAALNRYRFALRTADFLVCRECGVYLGAVFTDDGAAYAVLNINAFETPEAFTQTAVPVDYGTESVAERQARRVARWTPVDT